MNNTPSVVNSCNALSELTADWSITKATLPVVVSIVPVAFTVEVLPVASVTVRVMSPSSMLAGASNAGS